MRRIAWMAATLAIGIAAALPAQDSAAKSQPAVKPKWEFSVAPYGLFPTMQGTNTLGNLPPLSIDASASETFSHLQGGLMLYFEARKGDWAFATDVI